MFLQNQKKKFKKTTYLMFFERKLPINTSKNVEDLEIVFKQSFFSNVYFFPNPDVLECNCYPHCKTIYMQTQRHFYLLTSDLFKFSTRLTSISGWKLDLKPHFLNMG